MKKKNYWIRFSVLLVLIRFFSMVPVSAKWIINPSLGQDDTWNIGGITNDESNRVAYIEGDTDELGFTTIEAALAKATQKGGSQKVVVTKTSTINHDCQISTGVELRIPYNSSVTSFSEPSPEVSSTKSLNSSAYLTVSLAANLNVKGTLTIDGQFGCVQSTTGLVSDTFSQYSTLLRKFNSKITVFGSGQIRCFGFIKDDLTGVEDKLSGNGSSIEVLAGGSVWEPLTIYDWPGGSNAANLAVGLKNLDLLFNSKKRVFPRNQFDMPNIYCPRKINSGASLYGHILMNMGSAGKVNAKRLIVGSNEAFLNMSTGSLIWDYGTTDANQNRGSGLAGHKTLISVWGNASFGSMTITLSIATINSASFSRPMGPQFEIEAVSGTFTVGYKSHWFGNVIRIKKDATVLLTADTAIFDDSMIINDGVLSTTASFGGRVFTSNNTSTLAIGSNNNISGYFNIGSASVNKKFNARGYTSISATSQTQLESKTIYESALMTNKPTDGYWAKNNNLYLIRYNLNEHVTVSASVKSQMSQQRTRKYYNGAEEIQIVNPRDSELKRSYTTTTISGEGDNLTATKEEHSGYATFQGWNTDFYGAGKSITPGGKYTFSQLADQTGSHLIRLYDKWASDIKITIQFKKPSEICAKKDEETHNSSKNGRFDKIDGKQKDKTVDFFTSYTVPDCGYTIYERKWKNGYTAGSCNIWNRDWHEEYVIKKDGSGMDSIPGLTHKFLAWTFGDSSQTYTKDTTVWLDESILALCKSNGNNSYTLEATGNFQKEAS